MKSILATAIVAALSLSGCSSSTNRTEEARVASTQPAATSSETSASIAAREAAETQPSPPALGTETTTTISTPETSTTTTTSDVPSETTIPPSTTSTSTTTTTSTSTTTTTTSTTTTTTTLAPAVLRVQVLNGSGVAGAAGRLTNKLSQAGFDVLPAGNAPRRYSASAVYYAEGWLDEADEILAEADIDEIEEPTAMPQQFASDEAVVVVLLGTDTAPVRLNSNVKLPLGDDVPRDRYVPRLSNIQIYNEQTYDDEYTRALAHTLIGWLTFLGNRFLQTSTPGNDKHATREDVLLAYETIEEILAELGFTPQNVCGAPAGYSFRDLLQPINEFEWHESAYSGLMPTTTDRLLELHGGERINPEANIDFYIQQAVQAVHDYQQIRELDTNFKTSQLILCFAWKSSIKEVIFFANRNPVDLLEFTMLGMEIKTRNSWWATTATYHFKAISRNGNLAYVVECFPNSDYSRINVLWWRDGGYRVIPVLFIKFEGATSKLFKKHGHGTLVPRRELDYYQNADGSFHETFGSPDDLEEHKGYPDKPIGCQETFEEYDDILSGQVPDEWTDRYWNEDMIFFNFGERVFSGSDLLDFPRG